MCTDIKSIGSEKWQQTLPQQQQPMAHKKKRINQDNSHWTDAHIQHSTLKWIGILRRVHAYIIDIINSTKSKASDRSSNKNIMHIGESVKPPQCVYISVGFGRWVLMYCTWDFCGKPSFCMSRIIIFNLSDLIQNG